MKWLAVVTTLFLAIASVANTLSIRGVKDRLTALEKEVLHEVHSTSFPVTH